MTSRFAPPALALSFALVPAALAACGGEVVFVEDGGDGAGLAGPSGGGTPAQRIDDACEALCSLPCAGGGQPGCAAQCASAAPPGCEAQYAAFLACAFADIDSIDPQTCQGVGLCIEETEAFASCSLSGGGFGEDGGFDDGGGFGDDDAGPF